MEQFEKVCKGLEHEMQNRGQCGHYCIEGVDTVSCRYDKSGLCIQHWGKDALALIRKQQERIKELEAAQQWISVKDRLPEERKAVLAYSPRYKNIYAMMHKEGEWYIWGQAICERYDNYHSGEITYWMPLPEPPKEEAQE